MSLSCSSDIAVVFCELLLFVVISPAVSEHYLIFNFTVHIDSWLDSHQSLIPFFANVHQKFWLLSSSYLLILPRLVPSLCILVILDDHLNLYMRYWI